MKIYGNKDNKLDRIKKKDFDLQDKIYKEEDNKIKQPFFKFVIVVVFVIFALYRLEYLSYSSEFLLISLFSILLT